MSQVAAILCAGIRLTRQVLEPSFVFLTSCIPCTQIWSRIGFSRKGGVKQRRVFYYFERYYSLYLILFWVYQIVKCGLLCWTYHNRIGTSCLIMGNELIENMIKY